MNKQVKIIDVDMNNPELAQAILDQIRDWEEFQQERAERRTKNQTK